MHALALDPRDRQQDVKRRLLHSAALPLLCLGLALNPLHLEQRGVQIGKLAPVIAALSVPLPLQARTRGNPTSAATGNPCIHDGAGVNDGCDAAPRGALYQRSDWFTYARQSGQGAYANLPTYNVPYVTYPIGPWTADAAMLDPTVNVPSGCSYVPADNYLRCNAGAVLNGYFFNDVGLYVPSGNVTITNSHFRMSSAACRAHNGTALVDIGSGASIVGLNSNLFDFGAGCSQAANLYKQANDPGLTTQSSGVADISGTTLTFRSTPTGNPAAFQYVDCPGLTDPVYLASGASLSWTLSASQPNLSGVTCTTGPIMPNTGVAVSIGGGGTGALTEYYNVFKQWGTPVSTASGGNVTSKFNNAEMWGYAGQHDNFILQEAAPGSAATIQFIEDVNVILVSKYTSVGIGTGVLSTFATSASANTTSPTGYPITYSLSEQKYNIIVSNVSVNGGSGATTDALLRYVNQVGAATSNLNYSLSGGVVTVNAVNSGANVAIDQWISCAVNVCTHAPIEITSLITGSGLAGTYGSSNSLDTASNTGANVYLYPGNIQVLTWQYNFLDTAGAGTNGTAGMQPDQGNVMVGTENISNNTLLSNGDACSLTSCT